MLQDIRKENKNNRWGYALVAAAGIGMLFIGLPPLFGAGGNNPTIATVNGHDVKLQQYNTTYRQLQNDYPDMPAAQLKQTSIEQTIELALFEQQALDSHYLFSDVDLYHLIKKQFGDDKTYQSWLSNHRISAESYQKDIRRRETIVNYYQMIQPQENGQFSPLLENYLQTLTQKRSYTLYTLPIAPLSEGISVDDQALETFYQNHVSDYLTPETVDIRYTTFTLDDLAKTIDISDADLASAKAAQEQRAGNYLIFDRPEDAQAAEKAIKDGEKTFADYQKAIGDGEISGEAGALDLNFQGKGVLPEIDKALFSLQKTGDVSPVITSDSGPIIIELTKIDAGSKTDAELRMALARKAAESQYTELGNQAYDAAQSNKPLSAIVAITGGKIESLDQITPESTSAPFLAQDAVKQQIFGEKGVAVNKTALPVALSANESLFFTVSARKPAAPRPLADIKTEVERDYRDFVASEKLKERAETLATALKARDEEKVAELLQEYQISSEALTDVSLLENGAPTTKPLIQVLFLSPERVNVLPNLQGVAFDDNNARVSVLTGIKDGDIKEQFSEEDRQGLLLYAQTQNNTLFSSHLGKWLYDRAKIKINNGILQQL